MIFRELFHLQPEEDFCRDDNKKHELRARNENNDLWIVLPSQEWFPKSDLRNTFSGIRLKFQR